MKMGDSLSNAESCMADNSESLIPWLVSESIPTSECWGMSCALYQQARYIFVSRPVCGAVTSFVTRAVYTVTLNHQGLTSEICGSAKLEASRRPTTTTFALS